MSKHTQNENAPVRTHFEETRLAHKWYDMSEHELRREFSRSQFRGMIKFTTDKSVVPNGLGTWKWDTSGSVSFPFVSLVVLDRPFTETYGEFSREMSLAHMIVHVENGTQCTNTDPQYWDDAECEIELEAMHRMNWAPWFCDKWDPKTKSFVRYVPLAKRNAALPEPQTKTAIWNDLSYIDLARQFMNSRFNGNAIFTTNLASIRGTGFGSWEWVATTRNTQPHIRLVMADNPETLHHGVRTREAVLAHMLVHIERGTQCQSAEPQYWDDSEREVEFEAMRRMGWAPGLCDRWDQEVGDVVPWDRKNPGVK